MSVHDGTDPAGWQPRSNVCPDCGLDHSDQRTLYPVGAAVKSILVIHRNGAEHIPAGAIGTVRAHCEDGRAVIDFGYGFTDTFHYADTALQMLQPDEQKYAVLLAWSKRAYWALGQYTVLRNSAVYADAPVEVQS